MEASLTGSVQAASIAAVWAAQYAASEINAAGGIRGVPVKITAYDDAYNASQGVSVAAKIIPGSLMMLGPVNDTINHAVTQLVESSQILCMASNNSTELRSAMAPFGVACIQDTMDAVIAGATAWLQANPDITKVAMFYPTSATFDFLTFVPPALAKIGVTVVPENISFTQLDFGPQIAQCVSAGVQGYLDLNVPAGHVILAQNLYSRGINTGADGRRLFTSFSGDDPSLFSAGKGYLELSYIQELANPVSTVPAYQAMVAAYAAVNGGIGPAPKISGYRDALWAFKNAVETLGITGDPAKNMVERVQLAGYLYNSPTLHGIQFDYKYVNGKKIAPLTLLQIKNNQYTFVSTIPAVQ